MAINFRDLDVLLNNLKSIIPKTSKDWFAAINIRNDEGFANFAKNSGKRIKFGLQYLMSLVPLFCVVPHCNTCQ